ncbi:MAG TPA: potassium channel family protein [Actinomycetota bacterium]|nr:potassium channel family protein [Actinomycetota bacterium]
MGAIAVVAGAFLIILILWEAFEAIVLPRRVSRRLRLTRIFYRAMWRGWSAIGRRRRPGSRRENYLSIFAPLSFLLLLVMWAGGVILGFALIQLGLGTPLAPEGQFGFGTYLYLSGTTFVTLGLGDVVPVSATGRALTAVEGGAGFAFLALVIAYLPVMYQAFSRREVRISMLDQWAGSPPSAVELLRRAGRHEGVASIDGLLSDWEYWSAELLESHLSYPVLAYFRSQHDNQSWLSALTTILDLSALALAGVEGVSGWQARRTFAMARHAVVDLAHVFATAPEPPPADRLPSEEVPGLIKLLGGAGVRLDPHAEERLSQFRGMYEPYVHALSRHLEMPLPPLLPPSEVVDNWRTSAWGSRDDASTPGRT